MNESTENLRPAQKRRAPKKTIKATRTQCASWQEILRSGKHRQTRYQAVSIIHEQGPKTCREVADIIGCEPGSVTAALKSFENEGVLKVTHEKYNPNTKRWCSVYELNQGGKDV